MHPEMALNLQMNRIETALHQAVGTAGELFAVQQRESTPF